MENLEFKTNINCSGCVAKVSETLNTLVGENNWTVDTTNPEKILKINKKEILSNRIIEAIRSLGYKIEEKNK